MIVSVAMDSDIEAARPFVEAACPTYITLVDQNHVLSPLYNMVNVPQAVWINEDGKIVRPTETGGSLDILREFDPELGGFPEAAQARAQKVKEAYLAAVKDWAVKGADSEFAMSAEDARAHVESMDDDMAVAHTKFRLGHVLNELGRSEEAEAVFAECRQLHPDSWNIFRQTTEKLDIGLAAGEAFWGKVMSLGEKAYYKPIDMKGI